MDSFIFICNNETESECLQKELFGGTKGYYRFVKKVRCGTKLYLYNRETKKLHGAFEAVSDIAENIDPTAWNGEFPLQVQVVQTRKYKPLSRLEVEDLLKFSRRNELPSARISEEVTNQLEERFKSKVRISVEESDFRVENPGTIRTDDGHLVRSLAEKNIDDWLFHNKIQHGYECRVPKVKHTMFADFFILNPETGNRTYLEFWGLKSKIYLDHREKKIALYKKYDLQLIEIFPEDLNKLDEVMRSKLNL